MLAILICLLFLLGAAFTAGFTSYDTMCQIRVKETQKWRNGRRNVVLKGHLRMSGECYRWCAATAAIGATGITFKVILEIGDVGDLGELLNSFAQATLTVLIMLVVFYITSLLMVRFAAGIAWRTYWHQRVSVEKLMDITEVIWNGPSAKLGIRSISDCQKCRQALRKRTKEVEERVKTLYLGIDALVESWSEQIELSSSSNLTRREKHYWNEVRRIDLDINRLEHELGEYEASIKALDNCLEFFYDQYEIRELA